jgi:uncharacterized protein (DUF488 family)
VTEAVYTVGHSTHSMDAFLDLAKRHELTAIADVRSQPYSRYTPHFNREALRAALKPLGIAYVFLGELLGARTNDPRCYEKGRVQYDRLAKTAAFAQGLERVIEGASRYRVALMCAESDPITCHRAILVSRHLTARGIEIRHCLANGRVERQPQLEERLLRKLGVHTPDLFKSRDESIREAYRIQGEAIAYQEPESEIVGRARSKAQ